MAPAAGKKTMTGVDRLRAFQKAVPANKNCAVCKDRGPTYICTSYNTFVCSVCSGLHREFGHKIKSISLTEWNMLEVQSIEAGGNELNEATWLARWSPEALAVPNSSKQDTVREWIKKVYVEKCYFDSSGATIPKQAAPPAASTAPSAAPNAGATPSTSPDAAAAKPAQLQYVTLPTNTAYFCLNHNASEKRHKQEQPSSQPCSGCHVNFMTTYQPFTLCPSCSGSTQRCMICGASDEKKSCEEDKDNFDPSASTQAAPAGMTTSAGPMIDLLSGEEEQVKAAPSEEKWEADFGSESLPSVPESAPANLHETSASFSPAKAPASPGSDLFGDAACTETSTARTQRKPRHSIVGTPTPQSGSNDLDMLDLDFSKSVECNQQSPKSEMGAGKPSVDQTAPTSSQASIGEMEPAAPQKSEDTSAPIGERLREAVLSGSEKDIMKLYQEAKTPKVVEVVDPARSAKFAALQDEELNALFNGTSAEQESTSASDCGQSVSTSVEDQPRDLMQVPEGSASGDSPSVAHFFIGDEEEEDTTKKAESTIPCFTPGLGEGKSSQQMSAQQLSRLFAQQSLQHGAGSPLPAEDMKTQLSGKTPQQLQEMQAIINQMLQQQGGTQQQQQQGVPRFGGYPSGSSAINPQPSISKATPQFNFGGPAQFDQLFADSKHVPKAAPSTAADKQRPTLENAAKYCSPAYMQQESGVPEPPKPFGDLLSAFHEKNPIAGLNTGMRS
eukprot:gnl/MRDRNA2_/MRDRNA2_58513_c0_seq2.p1 gnl/MRDRNA2_/MRDRNA2_58513_c0~~gnl/MRDRNA2_/MRDRNA2_58513_c0_seq2.p1  ORF type:complete len:728 (+),score=193.73 gnl/MRDRNA2_/MRDRNA2_58513_c0_seq2:78-2261(+)